MQEGECKKACTYPTTSDEVKKPILGLQYDKQELVGTQWSQAKGEYCKEKSILETNKMWRGNEKWVGNMNPNSPSLGENLHMLDNDGQLSSKNTHIPWWSSQWKDPSVLPNPYDDTKV